MEDEDRPFIGIDAIRAKLIAERTLRRDYTQLYPGVYHLKGCKPSAVEKAEGAWLWSKGRGVLAGQSAAAWLGAKWVDGRHPAELIHDNRKSPKDLVVRSDVLLPGESLSVRGIAVTSAARTAFDIGRHTERRTQAVQRLDALANATRLDVADVTTLARLHPGVRGLERLRRVLPLVDGGAESPQETVARLALIDAGLPAPRTQVRVRDEYGRVVARLDMAYDAVKVGIEYDGPQHWEDPAVRQRDIDKAFELTELGWFIIRVSRDLLKHRRTSYVARVERALRDRGMAW